MKKNCSMWVVALFLAVGLVGCLSEPKHPLPRGLKLTGAELTARITGATVYGRYYSTNNRYIERHNPDGRYVLVSTKSPDADKYENEQDGTWYIKDDKVCYKVQSKNASGCAYVYEFNGQLEFVHPQGGRAWSITHKIEYADGSSPGASDSPPPVAAAPAPSAAKKPGLRPLGSGSGFIVNNQAYVLTNDHVIDDCKAVTVWLDGEEVEARIRARDQRNDLALLRLPEGDYPVAVFRANNTLYPGDSVMAIGYPLSDVLAAEGNVSLGIVSALAGYENDARLLQISAPVQPGNSGGPLFDMSGHVVGVIVAQLGVGFLKTDGTIAQNVNFAIKAPIAMAFMDSTGIKYRTKESTAEMRPSDVARKGRPASVRITCWG